MAHWLALEASDQVAVLAAVAGGMPAACTTSSQPTRCPSCSSTGHRHDLADRRRLLPAPGTERRTARPDAAAGRNGEPLATTDRCPPDGTGIGRTRVTTHIIDGGGHTWPDGTAEEVRRFAGPLLGNAETRRIS
jgi:poly(3-hydroxybutyrate) depolymerase